MWTHPESLAPLAFGGVGHLVTGWCHDRARQVRVRSSRPSGLRRSADWSGWRGWTPRRRDVAASGTALAACYAEQTDVRHPFAATDRPLRTRADLRRHFDQATTGAKAFERFETTGLRVHRTADPEVVVTEFRYETSADGQRVPIANILVTRVRDGMIIESRDYADHINAARAFGHLPALAATLAAEPS